MSKHNFKDIEWQARFTHQKVILFNEDDFDSKGTKLQIIKIKPGGNIEPHYHKVRTEAFYVLSGSGQIRQDDEIIECSEGDYLLCKPNTVHSFANHESVDFVVAVFRTNDPGDSDMLWVDKSGSEK